MPWIHFIEEIDHYLEDDEEILWVHRETHNLLSIIPFLLKTILIITIIFAFIIALIIYLVSIPFMILAISLYILMIVFSIIILIKGYRRTRKTIPLEKNKLRNYEFFYIITNKHYIRKDYYYHHPKRDFSNYDKNAFDQFGDTVFLKFDYVEEILVDYVLKEIVFKIKGFLKGRSFFIEFKENDEMEKVMGILKGVLPLELLEKKMGGIDNNENLYIKYTKK